MLSLRLLLNSVLVQKKNKTKAYKCMIFMSNVTVGSSSSKIQVVNTKAASLVCVFNIPGGTETVMGLLPAMMNGWSKRV